MVLDRLMIKYVQEIGVLGGEENVIVVRPFEEGDGKRMAKIASRAFPGLRLARLAIDRTLPKDAVREAYRREAEGYATKVSKGDKSTEILVAEEEGSMAGYVVLGANDEWSEIFGFKWASIVSLAVDPKFWGKGVGTKLVSEALRLLKKKGVGHVEVFTDQNNIAAIKAYEKNGFRIIHSGMTLSQYLEA